ncbi:ferredoxin [Dyadobacter luteus]|uniref:Ferredoxin n=1 Tax=Dyadobacter luteus TaxID=2259619 RepID=A0A3D8YI08_9BACT|nr:2Fe-2S iron-sulfur cluster-binding protein [Dyadobacter luteus]REA64466.1 ferredoxin [Dyadobacter luteus]
MIHVTVIDRQQNQKTIQIQETEDSNLMQILKEHNYEMRATCGGMALCADCHCLVLQGFDQLQAPLDQELDTLETRPDAESISRLACQLKASESLDGIRIKLTAYAC